jgi:hypothetical protein
VKAGLAQKRAEADRAALAEEREALACRAASAEAAWAALWEPALVAPRSPEEMRGWLSRHEGLVTTVDRLRAAEAEVEALRARMHAHAAELRAALAGTRAEARSGQGAPS